MTAGDNREGPVGGEAPTGSVHAFENARLTESVAHGGKGVVLAERVLERLTASGLRFVDFVDIPAGSTVGRHTHGADEELYIVISGRGMVELDGSTTEIGAGDVAVNRPGGTHALRAIGDAGLRMVVVCVAV
jgi:quercetin dioxygenase-like cupin family protein